MSKRSKPRRRPFTVSVMGETVTLNKGNRQGYLLLADPERGGAKVRCYVGRLLKPGVLPEQATTEDVEPAALEEAERLLSEYRAAGGVLPSAQRSQALTVTRLVTGFMADHGALASDAERTHFRLAFAPLLATYGSTLAAEFGPKRLKAVRHSYVESGTLSRWTVNSYVKRVRQAFAWAVENELLPGGVLHALKAVRSISAKQGAALGLREPEKVSPAADEHVDAVLPLVSAQVAAIVQLMRLTGCRCDEIVQLRPCDVDRSQEPWIYRPEHHKTEHHGHDRRVLIGPQARAILRPWLLRSEDSRCFSPREAEQARREALARARTTPLGQGNVPGSNRKRAPQREPGEMYSTPSVRRAIYRACEAAGVPRWSPHQLRHGAGTRFEREAGWDKARIVLGQQSVDVTAVYVERDMAAAAALVERIG